MHQRKRNDMEAWSNRPFEEANLFNPAFCSMLIAKACKDYNKKASRNLEFSLAFLILPVVLHPKTRAALPGTTLTSLLSWAQDKRADLTEFPSHARALEPFTREAMIFGFANGVLMLDETGGISPGKSNVEPTKNKTPEFTPEVRDCVDRAGFVGRWFAGAGMPSTIFSAFGVSP